MEPETQTEQPQEDSVEDRLASILTGDEPEQEEPSEEGTPPEQAAEEEEAFELEVDGEKYTLPKKLEKAVLQERDYTQKSQALAEQRKALDLVHEQARVAQMSQQFHTEVASELQQLHMLEAVIKDAKAVDFSTMSTDAILKLKIQLDNWNDQRNELFQKVEGKRQEWTQKQQTELESIKTKSLESIKKRIPGWDEDLAKSIREHALSDGYTEAELASIIDPRHAVTLWKAQQFDTLQAQAKKTVTDAKTVKTTPSNPMPQQVKERLNYRKAIAKVPKGTAEHQRLVHARVANLFDR